MIEYNVYCDESCHLPHDNSDVMVLGGVWIPKRNRQEVCDKIRQIKLNNEIPIGYELKWNNISRLKMNAYRDLINYFFDSEVMHFRSIIVKGKSKLNFKEYTGDYDDWYYKMYFQMLSQIFMRENEYNIYIDIKDTISSEKIKKLHDVCANSIYDFPHKVIKKIQPIRSDEVEIMQITDILIGAMSYYHRGLSQNAVKCSMIELIKDRSGYSLDKNSLLKDNKFNLFLWRPK